jgi:hypothetical protein
MQIKKNKKNKNLKRIKLLNGRNESQTELHFFYIYNNINK